ncbi:MAG: hypothetical protein U5P10_03710 [Spirochaetia bacterium]|nr:hypothetical protein [Spirochaetia bacterium]
MVGKILHHPGKSIPLRFGGGAGSIRLSLKGKFPGKDSLWSTSAEIVFIVNLIIIRVGTKKNLALHITLHRPIRISGLQHHAAEKRGTRKLGAETIYP